MISEELGFNSVTDLVAVLLSNELESIESEVIQGREEHILKTLDERGIAQELIGQQYSGRYPFELLQNANDAAAAAKADRSDIGVRFIVTDTALVVANMGVGFGPDEVRAICGLGRSSKDPRKSIGYKGLGFKSVGEITNVPQIISAPFRFGFDATRVRTEVAKRVRSLTPDQRLPIYAFPFPLSEADLGKDAGLVEQCEGEGFVTILRLPFRPGITRAKVEADLAATLSPRLLLFLPATDRLEVIGTAKSFRVERKTTRLVSMLQMELLRETKAPERWLVFEKRLPIKNQDLVTRLGDKWKEVLEVGVSVAVPEHADEWAAPMESYPLRVYFPTRERTGLPFIANGDFYLEMDRRYVSRTPEAEPYNNWLAAELVDFLAGHVGPSLASYYGQSPAVVSALAPIRDGDNFGEVIRGLYGQAMRRSRFIPAVDGRHRLAAEGQLLPRSTPRPSEAHEFLALRDVGRLVIPGVEALSAARRFLREDLEVNEMEARDALSRLTKPVDTQARADMYSWLATWAASYGTHAFARLLAEVACVHTTSGAWLKPSAGVYFPRERDAPDLSPELPIIIADVPQDPEVRSLLSEAGVKPFRWRELLSDSVLPLLEDLDLSEETRQKALEALRVYFETEGGTDKDISSRVGRVLLYAETSHGEKPSLRPASEIYFAAAWLDNDRLRTIYGPFDKPEFLAENPPADFQMRNGRYEYLRWLGVADQPRLDAVTSRDQGRHRLNTLGQHPHARYRSWWTEWLGANEVSAETACPEGHQGSLVLAASFALDRLLEIIESGDPARLGALFLELARAWATSYSHASTAVLRCQHGWHSGNRDRRIPSLLLHVLREADWVPARRGGQLVLAPPTDIWRAGQDMPRRVATLVSILLPALDSPMSVGFVQELGIVDSARATATQFMRLLTRLSEEFAEADDNFENRSRLVEAARWTMRRLNEALEGVARDDDSDTMTPLLSRLAGRHLFIPRPYYSDDVILSDTWQQDVPILDGDRGLQRVKSFFKLKDLADAVDIRPIASNVLNQQSEELRTHMTAAAGYLAALAIDTAASRAEIIHARLPRLEVVACRALTLSYELSGIKKTTGQLKTYIAKRVEEAGTRGTIKRMIGTAYVQISDPGSVDWYSFGRQLAEFLEVPTQGDAFAIILSGGELERKRYLSARGLTIDSVVAQQDALRTADELDLPDAFVELFEEVEGVSIEPEAAGQGEPQGDLTPAANEVGGDVPRENEVELPALDFDRIVGVDAVGHLAGGGTGVHRHGGPAVGYGLTDWQQLHVASQKYGRRGEEAVVGWERRRLAELGYDPEAVLWQSQKNEFSDFDVASLDDDGQRIYIEVKSSAGQDESTPFQISAAELRSALRSRSRYFIYRVVDVASASPRIVRYRDPIGLFQAANATLNLGNAWMRLPPRSTTA